MLHYPERPTNHLILSHTDIWGIGVTMFELLTLEMAVPFFPSARNRTLNDETLLARYPYRGLMKVILGCLNINPGTRFTAEQLQKLTKSGLSRFKRDDPTITPSVAVTSYSDYRLYHNDNDIEAMAPGWVADKSIYGDATSQEEPYQGEDYPDPDAPLLRPPHFAGYCQAKKDHDAGTNGRNRNAVNKDEADAANGRAGDRQGNPIDLISSKAATAGKKAQSRDIENESRPEGRDTARRRAIRDPAKSAKRAGEMFESRDTKDESSPEGREIRRKRAIKEPKKTAIRAGEASSDALASNNRT